jgi:hypothetical protein
LSAALCGGGANNGGASAAQFKCNGVPDTPARAGYKRDLILKHSSPVLPIKINKNHLRMKTIRTTI